MIILDAVTKSIEFKLLGVVTTNELPFVAAWADHDPATPAFTPGHTDGISNGTTAVTAVAAPGASTQRQLKTLAIFNDDSVAAVVILQYNNNATIRQLTEISVPANGTLTYTDGEGFRVIDSSGQILTAMPDATRSNVAETITAAWAFASEIDAQAGVDISGGTLQIGGSTVIDASENADFGGSLAVAGGSTLTGDVGIGGANVAGYALEIIADDILIDNGQFYRARRNSGSVPINVLGFRAASDDLQLKTSGDIFFTDTTLVDHIGMGAGDFGIGAGGEIFVDGSDRAGDTSTQENSANVYRVVAGGSGGVDLTSGATAWVAVSDERLKTIIEPIVDAVDKVGQLRAVIGRFKTDRNYKRRSFLIAQDVQKVLPEAVTYASPLPGALLGIKYEKVIPLLVAGFNELAGEVAALKKGI